jgi:hypothetical protein
MAPVDKAPTSQFFGVASNIWAFARRMGRRRQQDDPRLTGGIMQAARARSPGLHRVRQFSHW